MVVHVSYVRVTCLCMFCACCHHVFVIKCLCWSVCLQRVFSVEALCVIALQYLCHTYLDSSRSLVTNAPPLFYLQRDESVSRPRQRTRTELQPQPRRRNCIFHREYDCKCYDEHEYEYEFECN